MTDAARIASLERISAHLSEGRPDLALQAAAAMRERFPRDAECLRLSGIALLQLGRSDDALAHLHAARAIAPASLEVLANLASAQLAASQTQAALATLDDALRVAPAHPVLLNQLGNARHAMGDLAGARDAYRAATRASPDHVGAWCNLAASELALGDVADAERDVRRALVLAPGHPSALLLSGHVFAARGDAAAAMNAYAQGQRAAPDDARFPYEFGLLAEERKQLAVAANAQARALALDPSLHRALGQLAFLRRQLCEWRDLDALSRGVRERVAAGVAGIAPFGFLAEPGSAVEQLRCARIAASEVESRMMPLRDRLGAAPRISSDAALRIGFVSNGFGNHPTGLLCVALVEALREQNIETHLFATSGDDGSDIRKRLRMASRLHDVSGLGALPLAQAIRGHDIDVLVDLRVWGGGSVAEALALRPARVQTAWFAYPGTSGAPWIDYLIADRVVVPESLRAHFSERIAWLPRCFQPSDPTRDIGEPPSREACGLPAHGVVYACFNNSYKINPACFDRLLAPLREVAGSVLWLLAGPDGADERLREQSRLRGVDPMRLVFQKKLPHAQYLALYSHADLFLDTTPYGAHTTASDAIWAGCPVLTTPGETFASRVAASLNHHLGLPQLNASDDDVFVAQAIALGRDADARTRLRNALAQRRADSGLFDMRALAADFTALLKRMAERERAGLAPDDLA